MNKIYESEDFFGQVMEYAKQFVPPNKASGAVGRIKRSIYLLWHRTLRGRPIMDMFATPPARVRALLEAEGCRVLECREDAGSAGPDWRSYFYWVERR